MVSHAGWRPAITYSEALHVPFVRCVRSWSYAYRRRDRNNISSGFVLSLRRMAHHTYLSSVIFASHSSPSCRDALSDELPMKKSLFLSGSGERNRPGERCGEVAQLNSQCVLVEVFHGVARLPSNHKPPRRTVRCSHRSWHATHRVAAGWTRRRGRGMFVRQPWHMP